MLLSLAMLNLIGRKAEWWSHRRSCYECDLWFATCVAMAYSDPTAKPNEDTMTCQPGKKRVVQVRYGMD